MTTIEWKKQPTQIVQHKSKLDQGDIHLAVWREEGDTQEYQNCLISFGEFSGASHEGCLKTWPREAIRRVREQLDQFEAALPE